MIQERSLGAEMGVGAFVGTLGLVRCRCLVDAAFDVVDGQGVDKLG
jgi:hypothetical protein